MTTCLRATEALLAGGWFGSWTLFALVIAPTAFRELPSGEIAGQLVGPVLRVLHYYGIVAGVALFAIAFALRRVSITIALPLLLTALCVFSQFGVTAAIEAVRPSGFGPESATDAAGRFQQLHLLSRVLFGAVLIGTAVLIGLHARSNAMGAPSPPPAGRGLH